MSRPVRFAVVLVVLIGGWTAFVLHARATFPGDRTPEGAYARIVIALSEGRPRDCFAYLETQAQWASYTIRDFRAKARARIAASYPEPDRTALIAEHAAESTAKDGADVWLYHAERKGWLTRLRKDLSGIAHIEVVGDRATVETARGTRYAFRRRDNGIWGLAMFTGELLAEAEKAARDYELLDKAARDYERATGAGTLPAPAR